MTVRTYIAKLKLRGELMKCFKLGKMCREDKMNGTVHERYPKIHAINVDFEREWIRYTFTIPNGMNPELITKNEYLFIQLFGKHIEINRKSNRKTFELIVMSKDIPSKVPYDESIITPYMKKQKIPIVCGIDKYGALQVLDLTEEHHLLMTGTTGSGKSTLVRLSMVSLIKHKSPDEIQFLMADLKLSEFGIFKNLPHVRSIHNDQKSLLLALQRVQKEMESRGRLLDEHDVENISELKQKIPYLVVVIDEVILLKGNKKIMNILERISCVGRSNGVLLIVTMQRGSATDLGGQLKNNLVFRVSGKQSDENNAKISGLKSSMDINVPGRMAVSTKDGEMQVQVPYLTKQQAKKLLQPYKIKPSEIEEIQQIESLVQEPSKSFVNEFIIGEE